MVLKYGETPELKSDDHRDIVLTFDDGPSPHTPRLLDILRDRDLYAVFFVIGQKVATAAGRATVERMRDEGHLVGNHTYTHPNLRKKKLEEIREEIERTHKAICEITGECDLFRPPYGATNADVATVLRELSYQQLLWNVDTEDWKRKKNAGWVDYGMEQIKARQDCIVLMHDLHKSTVDNVPEFLNRVSRVKNCRFCLY